MPEADAQYDYTFIHTQGFKWQCGNQVFKHRCLDYNLDVDPAVDALT